MKEEFRRVRPSFPEPSELGYSSSDSNPAASDAAFEGLRRAPSERGDSRSYDGTQIQFRMGRSVKVSELLHALTFAKIEPLRTVGPEVEDEKFRPGSMLQRVAYGEGAAAVPEALEYGTDMEEVELPYVNNQLTPFQAIGLARLGVAVRAFRLDAKYSKRRSNAADDPIDWQLRVAASALLRTLDGMMGGTETQQGNFKSLIDLSGAPAEGYPSGRTQAAGSDLVADVLDLLNAVTPNGSGAGEGPHCLIGGPAVLKTLAMTDAGQRGLSGWRIDPRTGLLVYHFMGVPYYRTAATATSLYAANLGPTGLQLAYAEGTPDNFGVEIEKEPLAASRAAEQYVVHGAYNLVLWEQEALFELTGITNT